MSNFKCPNCKGTLQVWVDLDATFTMKVKPDGTLYKREITNADQTDGRAGIECTACDWEADVNDFENYADVVREAELKQAEIQQLVPKR